MANKSDQKPIKTAKLNSIKKSKFEKDFADIRAHYATVLSAWPETTQEQRKAFLDNSPFLKSVIDWSNLWQQ